MNEKPSATTEPRAYPEDWQEQGWCCRECALLAWQYNHNPETEETNQ